jgi:hypothetical protein
VTEPSGSEERRRPGNQTRGVGAREMGQSAWLNKVRSPYTPAVILSKGHTRRYRAS